MMIKVTTDGAMEVRFGLRLLYGAADSEKRIQTFETKCLRKLLRISYSEHKTKD